jgi:cytochrome P450
VDFLYHAVSSIRSNRALDFWIWIFDHNGAAAMFSYTSELSLLSNARAVITADPENIKTILATKFTDFGKGPQFHKEWKDFLGDSIFTTDGKQWHDSRQMIRPIFTRDRVGDLDIIEEHVKKLIASVGEDGRKVRFDRLLSRFSLDTSTHFLFGRSVGSLDEETSSFGNAFDEVQRVQSLNVRAGYATKVH